MIAFVLKKLVGLLEPLSLLLIALCWLAWHLHRQRKWNLEYFQHKPYYQFCVR